MEPIAAFTVAASEGGQRGKVEGQAGLATQLHLAGLLD